MNAVPRSSVPEHEASSVDHQLAHAAGLLWPNLPVLLLGSVVVAVGWSLVRALSPHLGLGSVVGLGLVVVPAFAVLLRGCEVLLTDEHFGIADLFRSAARIFLPALRITAVPTAAVLLTLSAVQVWQLSGQPWMLISVGLAAAVSVLTLYTGVVALPYLLRTRSPWRAGWLVSFYIATRNPVPVLAVLSAVALAVWAAAYLSFAVIVLLPAPLALVWAAAMTDATQRSQTTLSARATRAARPGRPL